MFYKHLDSNAQTNNQALFMHNCNLGFRPAWSTIWPRNEGQEILPNYPNIMII